MQTYTHGLTGTTIAAALAVNSGESTFKGVATRWLILMLVWGFGSILPDLVMAHSFFSDKFAGRTPLEVQPRWLINTKEVSHHLVTWAAIATIGLYADHSLLFFFGLAGFIHVVVDILTHGNNHIITYQFADPHYLWPVDLRNFGVWEYRMATGSLKPKPFELGVCIVALSTTILLSVKVFLPFV